MKQKVLRGFTLIELLVVIAVIALLASIILVSLQSARAKGKDTRVISDLGQFRNQLEADANASGIYQDFYFSPNTETSIDYGAQGPSYAAQQSTYCTTAQGSTPSITPCTNLVKLLTDIYNNIPPSSHIYFIFRTGNTSCGAQANSTLCPNMIQYAVAASLNSGVYYCVSSDGNASTYKNTTYMATNQSPDCSTWATGG